MDDCCHLKTDGAFAPWVAERLDRALDAADRYLGRTGRFAFARPIDRAELTRRLAREACAGELDPDFLWRAALARLLIEQRGRVQ